MSNLFTNFPTPISQTCTVLLGDKDGFAILAECTGTPPTPANVFAHGAIMSQTDSGTGSLALYENTGSTAVPVWSLHSTGGTGSGTSNTSPVYSVGSAANFSVLAGTANTFTATGITITAGNVGATTPTGTATYGSGSYTGTAAPYAQAIIDVAALKATLIGLSGTAITTPSTLETNNLSSLGAGIFAPGIYTTASAIGVTASATITLDGAGDYVFISTGGAITFSANVNVLLTNGATAARVFWVASTDLSTTGSTSNLVGNFLVRDATVASTATLNGRILASRAVVIAGVANTMTIPGGVQSKIDVADLSTGITPSHVVKYAGKITWSGGGASLATTVTGVAATDIVLVTVQTKATETGYVSSAAPTTNVITIVLSTANTSNDAVIAYEVLRAVS